MFAWRMFSSAPTIGDHPRWGENKPFLRLLWRLVCLADEVELLASLQTNSVAHDRVLQSAFPCMEHMHARHVGQEHIDFVEIADIHSLVAIARSKSQYFAIGETSEKSSNYYTKEGDAHTLEALQSYCL